ncbi:MAG TPA: hypothetical protein VK611_30290 [Acidimicrobiales bacterium]|nr:hypothetical protein [Acidimicrobiales bacterium]
MSEPWAASEAANHTADCIHELLIAATAQVRPKTVQWAPVGDGGQFEIIDARTGNSDRTIHVRPDGTVSRQAPNDELKSGRDDELRCPTCGQGYEDRQAADRATENIGLAATYPHEDGDTIVLGPEIFATKDGSVISWKGENYSRQNDRLRIAAARALERAEVGDAEEAAAILGEVVNLDGTEVDPT